MCIPKNTSHSFPNRLFRFRTLWCTFTRFNPQFSTLFTWFRGILLRSGQTNVLLLDCKQSRHSSCTELSHAQMCMQNIDHTLSWDGYDLSYLKHFHFRVIQNNFLCSYNLNKIRWITSEPFHTTEQSTSNIYRAWPCFLKRFFHEKCSGDSTHEIYFFLCLQKIRRLFACRHCNL